MQNLSSVQELTDSHARAQRNQVPLPNRGDGTLMTSVPRRGGMEGLRQGAGEGKGQQWEAESTLHPPQLPRLGRQQLGGIPGTSLSTSQLVTSARVHLSSLSSSLTSKLSTFSVREALGDFQRLTTGLSGGIYSSEAGTGIIPIRKETKAPRKRPVCSASPTSRTGQRGRGLRSYAPDQVLPDMCSLGFSLKHILGSLWPRWWGRRDICSGIKRTYRFLVCGLPST